MKRSIQEWKCVSKTKRLKMPTTIALKMYNCLISDNLPAAEKILDYCEFHKEDLIELEERNILSLAIQRGNVTVVTKLAKLLKHGVNPNSTTIGVVTPLHWASEKGEIEMVKELLNNGAFIDAQDQNQKTPLFRAVSQGKFAVVTELLKRGANPNITDSFNTAPLQNAVAFQHESLVKELLQNGANPNNMSFDGETALHFASKIGALEIVESLIAHKANINLPKDIDGKTPLHVACENQQVTI